MMQDASFLCIRVTWSEHCFLYADFSFQVDSCFLCARADFRMYCQIDFLMTVLYIATDTLMFMVVHLSSNK
jgi:hypothetical protein